MAQNKMICYSSHHKNSSMSLIINTKMLIGCGPKTFLLGPLTRSTHRQGSVLQPIPTIPDPKYNIMQWFLMDD